MKRKVFRLTESDLHNIIKNTVNRILKEDINNESTLLKMFLYHIKNNGLKLDINGSDAEFYVDDIPFFIDYKINSNASYESLGGDGYITPNYNELVNGDNFDFEYFVVVTYDEYNNKVTVLDSSNDPNDIISEIKKYISVDYDGYEGKDYEDEMY